MKHKFLASLLALSMLLGLLPGTALAAENDTAEEPVVYTETGEEPEGDPADVPDEPDEAPVEGEDDTTVIVPEQEEPVVEEPTAVKQLQARIDVLPDAEKLEEMDGDELALVYAEVDAIYDAIDELTAEEAAELDVTALEEAAAFFTRQIMTLEGTNDDEETAAQRSGNCGATDEDKVTWALTDDDNDGKYTLTISGTGAMADYTANIGRPAATQPWREKETGIAVTEITKIVVAEGVTKIGDFSFNGINQTVEYDIAATVETIGDWSIDIYSAKSFILNGNEKYKVDDDGVLLTVDGKTLVAYPGGAEPQTSYTIPSTVETVAPGAFVGCDAAKLVIPSTVISLPQWSFSSGTIQEIVCNAGMETLPTSVFSGINSLEKISFGSAIKILPEQVAPNCANLRDVILPDGLTSIGDKAFLNCAALSEIEFPEGLTSIGSQAFSKCSALTSLVFPDSLTTIGNQAFIDCTALSSIEFPASLQSIGSQVFQRCKALSCIEFPANLQSIGYAAFMDCTALSGIEFPEGLTTIGSSAFNGCSALTTLVFPDGLKTISSNAFNSCTGLKYVVHGSGIDDIGGDAFSGCTDLKVIDIHRSENIGEAWDNGDSSRGGDPTLNHACQRTLTDVRYYMRSENQAKAAKGDIEWGNGVQGGGNTSNTYYVLTATDAVPDYSGTTNIPQRTGYTFNGWKAVTVSDPQNVYTDEGQWQKNSYEANASTATITQKTGSTPNGSATLKAKTLAYDGQPKEAVVETAGAWTGGKNVTYAKQGEAEYTDTVPVAAGKYTAKLTVGEGDTAVTVSVNFEITKSTPTLSYDVKEVSKKSNDEAFTNPLTAPSYVTTVTYSSSDKNVATVDTDGKVTIVGVGTATITAKAEGTDNYNGAEASYELTVTAPSTTPGNGGSSSGGSHSSSSSSSSSSTYPVAVDSTKNGTVSVSPKNAKKDATVVITVKANSGYELDELTVTDKNGKNIKVTEGKNGKFTFTMPAGKVTVEATFAKAEETPERRFTDVPEGYWAEDAIEWAAENGYMNGNTATTFNPDGTVTRQQLWMILARLSGYQPADFAEAKAWAVDNGVSDGSNPGSAVTRQQLVTILYRYAAMMGYKTTGTADLTAFPDHASVADYAKDAMSWSVANGIVGGTTAGTLNPTGTATRAQFAVILMRFAENMTK